MKQRIPSPATPAPPRAGAFSRDLQTNRPLRSSSLRAEQGAGRWKRCPPGPRRGDGFSLEIDAGRGQTPTRRPHFFQVVAVSAGQLPEDRRATLSPQPASELGLASVLRESRAVS